MKQTYQQYNDVIDNAIQNMNNTVAEKVGTDQLLIRHFKNERETGTRLFFAKTSGTVTTDCEKIGQ